MDAVVKLAPSKKQSGGSRKLGRNKKKCARYFLEGRKEKNRSVRRLRNPKREAKLAVLREKRQVGLMIPF